MSFSGLLISSYRFTSCRDPDAGWRPDHTRRRTAPRLPARVAPRMLCIEPCRLPHLVHCVQFTGSTCVLRINSNCRRARAQLMGRGSPACSFACSTPGYRTLEVCAAMNAIFIRAAEKCSRGIPKCQYVCKTIRS